MKKLLAVLLAVMMLLTLTACKSEEQKAADKFLKDTEKLCKELIKAIEDEDADAFMDVIEESEELDADYEEIYEDLKDEDKDAAKKFKKAYEDLQEEYEEKLEDLEDELEGLMEDVEF